MPREINLQVLPNEAVDVGFEQFQDRLQNTHFLIGTTSAGISEEAFEIDAETKTFKTHFTPAADILRDVIDEKLESMIREAERGERPEFTPQELRAQRARLGELFTTNQRKNSTTNPLQTP